MPTKLSEAESELSREKETFPAEFTPLIGPSSAISKISEIERTDAQALRHVIIDPHRRLLSSNN